ncbi:MAG: hypothetical protein ACRDT4_13785 [Micromonosporaceae bacterium]
MTGDGVVLTVEDAERHAARLPHAEAALLGEIISAQAATPRVDLGGATAAVPWLLDSIEVSGHVGVGSEPVRLSFGGGPGIVIVTARNGTGKTSIADALRHVLSGGQARPYKLAPDNLDCPDRNIRVELSTGPRTAQVRCRNDQPFTWSNEEGVKMDPPAGWVADYLRYLPILLYPEVSATIEDPAKLHTFLKGGLDLDVLTAIQDEVKSIRTSGSGAKGEITDSYETAKIAAEKADLNNALTLLTKSGATPSPTNRAAIEAAIAESPEIAAYEPPALPEINVADLDVDLMVDSIHAYRKAVRSVVSGADETQKSLQQLVEHGGDHLEAARRDDICPACGTQGVGWQRHAQQQAEKLATILRAARSAESSLREHLAVISSALPEVPPSAEKALTALGSDATQVIEQWQETRGAVIGIEATTVSPDTVRKLAADIVLLRRQRGELVRRLNQEYNANLGARAQLRAAVEHWLNKVTLHHETVTRAAVADRLDKAIDRWIKSTRDAVFEPIGQKVSAMWAALNPDSGLTLTGVKLGGGTKQAGKVNFGIRAGSTLPPPATATHVLSTGQRNALSLATYLPRATQASSPFGFLVLDDPIQAFDSWRVRYLARQLVELSERYQILVLTHDERLWQELRGLGYYARHLQLDRDPDSPSHVRVSDASSPGMEYLADLRRQLQEHDREPIAAEESITALALALCRTAVDAEAAIQLEIMGRRAGHTAEIIARDRDSAHTTRGQIDLLNTYAGAVGAPMIDVAPYDDTIRALNMAAYGRAPVGATAGDRSRWLLETETLIHLIAGIS